MSLLNLKSLRVLSAILVILSVIPTPPLLAQSRAPGAAGQFFNPSSGPKRVGGSSFGTKSRADTPLQMESQTSQYAPLASPRFLQGTTYQVHILGEVTNPGTYRVPASTRLSEAVALAGGILERGAKRGIQLRRKGSKTQWVDLLSFKMLGNLNANPYLLDNDVVFVPLKKRVVQIAGSVKRPDSYELTGKTSLYRLVRLAGGFAPGVASSAPAKVIRYTGENKELIDVPLEKRDMQHFYVRSADVVVIPHLLTIDDTFDYNIPSLPGDTEIFFPSFEERVFVLGAVFSPGPYAYSPYYKVREYLTQAGGLTKLAKAQKHIHVIRTDGKRVSANYETDLNPGDTIVVPERYMRPESMVQLILGIASAALGITTTILALTR